MKSAAHRVLAGLVSGALLAVAGASCARTFEPGVVIPLEDRAGCGALSKELSPTKRAIVGDAACTDGPAPCRAACDRGDLPACGTLARWTADGDGVDRDLHAAQSLAGDACERGFSPSCMDAGRWAVTLASLAGGDSSGTGAPSTVVEATAICDAFQAYRAGCELGDSQSCELLATVDPDLLDVDEQLAVTRGRASVATACEGGDMRACVSCVHRHVSVEPELTAGKLAARDGACHEAACKQGYALGCVGAAYARADNFGGDAWYGEVLSHLARLCEIDGSWIACSHQRAVAQRREEAESARQAFDAREASRADAWARAVEANRALRDADSARFKIVRPDGKGDDTPFDWSTLRPTPASPSGISTCAGGFYGTLSTGSQGYVCP